MHILRVLIPSLFSISLLVAGCGGGSDDLGVAAECTSDADCAEFEEGALQCLLGFKGGYCGLVGCEGDADCPSDALCVRHEDGANYCFRTCAEKAECNANRTAENEANCSSSVERLDGGSQKACVPPSN